jgi:hypothetical protein
MNSYPQFHAAEHIPAAFGAVPAGLAAVPAGLAAVPALRNCDTTGTVMTKVFGRVRPPRKIPL